MTFDSVKEYNEWLTKQLEDKVEKPKPKPAAKKTPTKPVKITED